ncbi:MAG: acylphosphatase [Thermoguttaceae bacterium]
MASTDAQRREVYYSGRVQGVGFRYTARSIAQGFAVTGFVKNLRDGRVQIVVEGATTQVQAMLSDIRATMGRYITGVEEISGPPTGRFSNFEVRF